MATQKLPTQTTANPTKSPEPSPRVAAKLAFHPDIQYLKNDQISEVIAEGCAVLYQEQPPNPHDFLAKWLLNYAQQEEKKQIFVEREKKRKELVKKQKIAATKQLEKAAEEHRAEAEIAKVKDKFTETLAKTDDPIDILDVLSNHLLEFTKSSGVYVGKLEQLKKGITEDDDERAHIDETQPWVIKYIAASKGHEFMLNKSLNVSPECLTNNVFNEKVETPEEGAEEGEGKEEGAEEKEPKKDDFNSVFVPEVVREPKLKFFRVPKLGSYLAVPMIYNSCLFESASDDAFANYKTFIEAKEDVEKRREELKETIEKDREDAEAAGEEYNAPNLEEEIPEAKEEPYSTHPISFVVCLDTMGQDRAFTDEEREYVIESVKTYIRVWETKEQDNLTKDKMKRYNDSLKETEFLENELQALEDEEDQQAEEELQNLETTEEEDKDFETRVIKLHLWAKQLKEGQFSAGLMELIQYKVIKMRRILQSVFYLLGYDREEICEEATNSLFWKKARLLFNPDLLKVLEGYSPLGPIEGVPPRYRLINNIEKNLTGIDEEDVKNYSVPMWRLWKWIDSAVKIRIDDIKRRKAHRLQMREDKENKEKEFEERKTKYDEELAERLEKKRGEFEEEEKEWLDKHQFDEEYEEEEEEEEEKEPKTPRPAFNEEEVVDEFLKEFEEDNAAIEIPSDVLEEKDDDYEWPDE